MKPTFKNYNVGPLIEIKTGTRLGIRAWVQDPSPTNYIYDIIIILVKCILVLYVVRIK